MGMTVALVLAVIGLAILIGGFICLLVVIAKVRNALASVEKGR